jgi:hypothetical protein
MLVKFRIEGFRVSIFIFVFGKLLYYLTGSSALICFFSAYFLYFTHGLVVFELPQGGPHVGH